LPNPFSKSSGAKPKEDSPRYVNIQGLFECYTCYEGVREAEYDTKTKWLVWSCSKGHENSENMVINVRER
jgi:hypothetical protein